MYSKEKGMIAHPFFRFSLNGRDSPLIYVPAYWWRLTAFFGSHLLVETYYIKYCIMQIRKSHDFFVKHYETYYE